MATLLTLPIARVQDADGTTYPGAKLFAYLTGTSTPTSIYTTAALNVAHPNPVVADSGGFLPPIFLNPRVAYRFVAKTSAGAAIPGMDFDPVSGESASGIQLNAYETVGDALTYRKSVKAKGAKGDFDPDTGLGTDDTAAINATIASCTAGQTLYFPPGNYRVSRSSGYLALTPIPIGVDVEMDGDAWLYVDEDSLSLQILTPLGKNRIKVNIDGRCLPEGSTVQSADWITNPHVGIRAAFDPGHGRGAEEVTIHHSRFRNLDFAVHSEGAQKWRIEDVRGERIRGSMILFGYLDDFPCLGNIVTRCRSDQTGDTSVAFFRSDSGTGAELAHNVVALCHAKDSQLRTQGFAFDIEARSDLDASLQHHNFFLGLTVEQTVTGLAWGIGGAVMNSVSHSAIIGGTFAGSLNSTGDFGIAMGYGTRDSWIGGGCQITHFRASGITTDGCAGGVDVDGVNVVDCGGNSSTYSAIQICLAFATSGVRVLNSRVTLTSAYAYAGADSCGIGLRAPTFLAEDIEARGNRIVSPWGCGIYLTGAAGHVCQNLKANDNEIIGTDPAGVGTSDPGLPMQIYYANQVRISRPTLKNVGYGYFVQNCTKVRIDGGEIDGALAMVSLYDLGTGGTASTDVKVRNMTCYPAVATVIANAGTGTIWDEDDKVPLTDAADDAAAAGAGIPIGMKYRTGSILKVRVA